MLQGVLIDRSEEEDGPDYNPVKLFVDGEAIKTDSCNSQSTSISQSMESLILLSARSNVSSNYFYMDKFEGNEEFKYGPRSQVDGSQNRLDIGRRH